MEWDLGILGLATLLVMALSFGLLAQLFVGGRTTGWLWLIASTSFFVAGLFTSEVWFGWATEEDLQPNIDGLSFDEVLLVGLIVGFAAVFITKHLAKRDGGDGSPAEQVDVGSSSHAGTRAG